VLLGLSFLSAFVLPTQFTSVGFPALQGVFAPVSWPVRGVAGWVFSRVNRSGGVVDDQSPGLPRSVANVYEENHALLTALASLQVKYELLSQLNADRQAVGDIRPLCTPATVTGAEGSGLHESLTISVGTGGGVRFDQPVIRGNPSQSPLPCDLVGRVARAGPLGAQVRLVTDPGFVVTVRFGRHVADADGKLVMRSVEKLHPLLQGIGHNAMAIRSTLSMQQVRDAGLAVNDLVMLDDPEWPANIQGFSVGRIVSIEPQRNAPLFADIRVEPQINLLRLTEVMVMVKDR
jgi:cell shape-determining protein MreC